MYTDKSLVGANVEIQQFKDGRLMSWADRFLLIDRHQPAPAQICATFGITLDEMTVARQLLQEGVLGGETSPDVSTYPVEFFTKASDPIAIEGPTSTASPDDIIVPMLELYTPTPPKVNEAGVIIRAPQRRGKGGSKITEALLAVPTVPTPVETFARKMDVSVAVLRQSTRFIRAMTPDQQSRAGAVFVRKDPITRVLMIWKEMPAE